MEAAVTEGRLVLKVLGTMVPMERVSRSPKIAPVALVVMEAAALPAWNSP